jgi:hypothetical protein
MELLCVGIYESRTYGRYPFVGQPILVRERLDHSFTKVDYRIDPASSTIVEVVETAQSGHLASLSFMRSDYVICSPRPFPVYGVAIATGPNSVLVAKHRSPLVRSWLELAAQSTGIAYWMRALYVARGLRDPTLKRLAPNRRRRLAAALTVRFERHGLKRACVTKANGGRTR